MTSRAFRSIKTRRRLHLKAHSRLNRSWTWYLKRSRYIFQNPWNFCTSLSTMPIKLARSRFYPAAKKSVLQVHLTFNGRLSLGKISKQHWTASMWVACQEEMCSLSSHFYWNSAEWWLTKRSFVLCRTLFPSQWPSLWATHLVILLAGLYLRWSACPGRGMRRLSPWRPWWSWRNLVWEWIDGTCGNWNQ